MRHFRIPALTILALALAARLHADDSFSALLRSATEHIDKRDFNAASTDFDRAFARAGTDTERALALVKRAHMLAFQQQQYEKAREDIIAASGYRSIQPVAMVTLLEVRAECEVRLDNDKIAAAKTLEDAAALKGVDWALPGIHLKRGDVYRTSARPREAILAYEQVLALPNASKGARAVAHLNLGLTHQYSLRDPLQARKAYAEALAINPDLESEISEHLERMK